MRSHASNAGQMLTCRVPPVLEALLRTLMTFSGVSRKMSFQVAGYFLRTNPGECHDRQRSQATGKVRDALPLPFCGLSGAFLFPLLSEDGKPGTVLQFLPESGDGFRVHEWQ